MYLSTSIQKVVQYRVCPGMFLYPKSLKKGQNMALCVVSGLVIDIGGYNWDSIWVPTGLDTMSNWLVFNTMTQ